MAFAEKRGKGLCSFHLFTCETFRLLVATPYFLLFHMSIVIALCLFVDSIKIVSLRVLLYFSKLNFSTSKI